MANAGSGGLSTTPFDEAARRGCGATVAGLAAVLHSSSLPRRWARKYSHREGKRREHGGTVVDDPYARSLPSKNSIIRQLFVT
jgi:hypothetical protein